MNRALIYIQIFPSRSDSISSIFSLRESAVERINIYLKDYIVDMKSKNTRKKELSELKFIKQSQI